MLLNKRLNKAAFCRSRSSSRSTSDTSVFIKQRSQLEEIIKTLPTAVASYAYPSENKINPAYCEIDHAQRLNFHEKRIWVLRGDMILAIGIKNAYVEIGNTKLFDVIEPSKHQYINIHDRYGHPSLAIPSVDFDGSAYYAGWLYQHSNHIEIYLCSGRFHNDKLSLFENIYLEQYISLKLIEAFGDQDIVFYDWQNPREMVYFLNGRLSTLNKDKRVYSKANNFNNDLLNNIYENKTPLHAATLKENINIVQYLISQGVNLNTDITTEGDDNCQLRPLDIALSKNTNASQMIRSMLINAGATSTPILNKKTHLIHIMAKRGELNIITNLVYHMPELIYIENEHGQTALSLASAHNQTNVSTFLKNQKSAFKENQHRIASITPLSIFRPRDTHKNSPVIDEKKTGYTVVNESNIYKNNVK